MRLGQYLGAMRAADVPPDALLGGLATALGAPWDGAADLPPELQPPAELVAPDLLGHVHEAITAPVTRKRRGVHYTPARVADRLVAIALDGLDASATICDPAVGGGAFLLAAGRALADRGEDPAKVVAELLWGVDLDPLAVAVTRATLALWCEGAPPPADHVDVGDGLELAPDTYDVVVGNPPFQSQLFARTARDPADRPDGAGAYTDTATLFLLAATRAARAGGRVVLIQPQSVLASRDAAPARIRLADDAALEGLWVADDAVFSAATRVCAPVLRIGVEQPPAVARWKGADVIPAEPAPPGEWASLAAGLRDVPTVDLPGPPLDELATATAGFRDEYYGLVPFVAEASGPADDRPRLVTSGLVDPAHCRWGEREARFARSRYQAPVVDVAALAAAEPRLGEWVAGRLQPKVLVATQTRVVEAVVDETGILLPSTPVVSIVVDPDRLWATVAVLLSPPVTAWALHRTAGTALAAQALKLSARQIRTIPAPTDAAAWADGAALAEAAHRAVAPAARHQQLLALGAAMAAAYRVSDADPLVSWWAARLPSSGA